MKNELNSESQSGKLSKSIVRNLISGAIILAIIAVGFIILINKDSEINQLRMEASNLSAELQQRDSVINALDGAINEIENSFTFIKTRREQIEFNFNETGKAQTEQIIDDIALMNSILEESEKKIEELSKKLEASEVDIKSFRTRLAILKSELQSQNTIVSNLKKELQEKNTQLAKMDQKLDTLTNVVAVQIDSINYLADSVNRSSEKIQLMEQDLNKAYWVQGTFKELKENDVIVTSGGFLGLGRNKTLNKEFNDSNFIELDIRNTEVIPLNVKKAEIISEHANHSYSFVYQDDLIAYLKIEDPGEFWKLTKYAIIEVKE